MKKSIIAIEGLVHAGKTTLIKRLAERDESIQYVGEYVDFIIGKFPDYPSNLDDASRARKFFLNLEKKRRACIHDDERAVVLDRSVLSILAYHFAVETITGGKNPCFSESMHYALRESWIFPDRCIYLDVSDREIARRHQSESGHYNPILLNPDFNAQLRTFYEKVIPVAFPLMNLARISADKSLTEVFLEAEVLLVK